MQRLHPRHRRTQARRGGFTLLEILIVVAIIMVIAAMAVPNLLGSQRQANIDLTQVRVRDLEQVCKRYATDHHGEFASGGTEVLDAMLQPSEYQERQLEAYIEDLPVDAWGNRLNYEYTTSKHNHKKPAIWSNGPDAKDDGGQNDDIVNWTREA